MNKKIITSLAVGSVLSGVTLYLAFRNVPLRELGVYLASIDYRWILPAAAAVLLSFILRTLRWQVILGSVRQLGFRRVFHPLMIGFMLNCILPGRVGELARPAILQKNEHVPFSAGLATVATERIFDMGLLIGLLAVVFSFVEIDPSLVITFGDYQLSRETLLFLGKSMVQIGGILIAGVVVVSLDKPRRLLTRAVLNIPALFFWAGDALQNRLRRSVAPSLAGFLENFASGLALTRDPRKIFKCLGLSLCIWGVQALSYYLLALGAPGIGLTFIELGAVMIIVCFFIALPSVPGFWGLWEAGGVFALSLFGIAAKDAAGYHLGQPRCPDVSRHPGGARLGRYHRRKCLADYLHRPHAPGPCPFGPRGRGRARGGKQKTMTILEIHTFPDAILRNPTKPVKNIDGRLQQTIDDMAATMYSAPGIGLAAIQVGIDQSILVYDITPRDETRSLHVLINPRIISSDGETISTEEGCLSVPDFRADVNRDEFVLVEGVDRDGNPLRIEAHDFLAIVLQHEIDHLNGKLFIDRISPLKRELYKRRVKKQLKQK